MDVRITHDAKQDEVQREEKQYLQEQECKIWKKALQYENIRRAGLLEGFQGDIDCSDWMG